jgi:arginyl-tRNA synthetase
MNSPQIVEQQLRHALHEAWLAVGGDKTALQPDKIHPAPTEPWCGIHLEHPAEESHGDYSSNIAMAMFARSKQSEVRSKGKNKDKKALERFTSPRELAQAITDKLLKTKSPPAGGLSAIDKVEVAGPGFINLWLKHEYLISEIGQVVNDREEYGQSQLGKDKQYMVEFAHPNTHKAFHIGHLRNISTGEALVRILEYNGYRVVRTNYQGDVGIHIAKCLWGMKQDTKFSLSGSKDWDLETKAKYMGQAYVVGSNAYETDETKKQEVIDINYLIYAAAQQYQQEQGIEPGSVDYMQFVEGKKFSLKEISELWVETRQWSLDYFDSVYERVYSHFDKCYFESQCLKGIDVCYEALKKRILTRSKGAVVFDGTPYGLDTRVFVNSLGLPTYEGKELGLAPQEFSDFGHIDRIIHVVTPEQTSFFKITFKVEELLGIQKDQQYHLAYEWVKLKEGKMSSRQGNVILGEWLLDEVKARLKKAFPKTSRAVLEQIAVGATKYSFLKQSVYNQIAFDIDESISLEGDSGPYLQYTYARTQSVLAKSKVKSPASPAGRQKSKVFPKSLNAEELSILRWLYRFPEVVKQAGEEYAPNVIANFLYELAGRFNVFYNKHRILEARSKKQEVRGKEAVVTSQFRLLLTTATGQVLKNGLTLLGIPAPEKM